MLQGLFGNASEIEPAVIQKELADVLIEGEKVERAFKLIRDLIIFTDKRLVLVDKQGITGNKVEYHSIPYRSIHSFAIETAGRFDLDADLKLWMTGGHMISKDLKKGADVVSIQKMLARFILK